MQELKPGATKQGALVSFLSLQGLAGVTSYISPGCGDSSEHVWAGMQPGSCQGRDADIAGVFLQVPGCFSPKRGCFAAGFAMFWGAFLDRGTE